MLRIQVWMGRFGDSVIYRNGTKRVSAQGSGTDRHAPSSPPHPCKELRVNRFEHFGCVSGQILPVLVMVRAATHHHHAPSLHRRGEPLACILCMSASETLKLLLRHAPSRTKSAVFALTGGGPRSITRRTHQKFTIVLTKRCRFRSFGRNAPTPCWGDMSPQSAHMSPTITVVLPKLQRTPKRL